MEEKIFITLTKSQCKNLAEFIEFHLMSAIRGDEDIDNINWVCDMCESYKTLAKQKKHWKKWGKVKFREVSVDEIYCML